MPDIKLQIKGFPLIKFHPSDRTKGLLDGCLYMKTLDWYRKLENESSNCLIGDFGEALWHVNEATISITPINDGEPEISSLNDAWLKTVHSNDFAFCMTGINPQQFKEFNFTPKQKEEMIEFGDTALLITDVYEFCRRIKKKTDSLGYKVTSNFINYYDESIDEVNKIILMMFDMREIAFQKRQHYSFQQEYRFLVTSNCKIEKDFIILKIGDIRDISAVCKTELILESKVVGDNPNELLK